MNPSHETIPAEEFDDGLSDEALDRDPAECRGTGTIFLSRQSERAASVTAPASATPA